MVVDAAAAAAAAPVAAVVIAVRTIGIADWCVRGIILVCRFDSFLVIVNFVLVRFLRGFLQWRGEREGFALGSDLDRTFCFAVKGFGTGAFLELIVIVVDDQNAVVVVVLIAFAAVIAIVVAAVVLIIVAVLDAQELPDDELGPVEGPVGSNLFRCGIEVRILPLQEISD